MPNVGQKQIKKGIIIFLAAIVSAGFTWPWDAVPAKKDRTAKNTRQQEVQIDPIGAHSQEIESQSRHRISEEVSLPDGPDREIEPASASVVKQTSGAETMPKIENSDAELIQRQIDQILASDRILRASYQTQAAEIRTIMDQTRIHQRILNDLMRQPPAAVDQDLKAVNAQEILKQEKIRLIYQQTQKNQEILNHLRTNRVKPAVRQAATVLQARPVSDRT